MVQPYSGSRLQCATQLKTLTIITDKTDRIDSSHAERGEIVQYRAGAARLRADVNHIENRQTCLDGGLLLIRIDFEISVEAKITQHSYPKTGIFTRQ